MPIEQVKKQGEHPKEAEEICLFAQTNFRNQVRKFGIKTDDRRRHMYIIGKTGMGKTTMLENMVLHDIYNGHGIGIVDPHGDFAEKILDFIPANRINDVVYFNPADGDNPIGFNVLEVHSEEQKFLIAAGLMGVFKKIWPDVWSGRMEYILNNVLLALLDSQGSTLLGINRMLSDKKYRKQVVSQIKDPVVKKFWVDEYASWTEKYAIEAGSAIQNKIGQFLSASLIRNMVAQVKSTINVRNIMDSQKIFIMNLSKGRIGEDSSRLLGGMLITQIQLAAMERVDTPEADRKDFFLYVDEFQNFATPSFANILSEARKYRLSLIMAHQYIAQLDEVVRDAVFGNVGTMVSFRVGAADAEYLEQEFTPTFLQEDIVNLSKFRVFLKLMIDGVASQPFSASTIAPIGNNTGNKDKVIRVSRERYGKPRSEIEDKIARWSGMEIVGSVEDIDSDYTDEFSSAAPQKKDNKKDSTTEKEKPKQNNIKADDKVLALKQLLESKKTTTTSSSSENSTAPVVAEARPDPVPQVSTPTTVPVVPSTHTQIVSKQEMSVGQIPVDTIIEPADIDTSVASDTRTESPKSIEALPDSESRKSLTINSVPTSSNDIISFAPNTITQSSVSTETSATQQKKKRKRKRKKKSHHTPEHSSQIVQRDDGSNRQPITQPNSEHTNITVTPPRENPVIPPVTQASLPPNTLITFDS
jgi:hypothetical protein